MFPCCFFSCGIDDIVLCSHVVFVLLCANCRVCGRAAASDESASQLEPHTTKVTPLPVPTSNSRVESKPQVFPRNPRLNSRTQMHRKNGRVDLDSHRLQLFMGTATNLSFAFTVELAVRLFTTNLPHFLHCRKLYITT